MRGAGYHLLTRLLTDAGHTSEQAAAANARAGDDVLDRAQANVTSTGCRCPTAGRMPASKAGRTPPKPRARAWASTPSGPASRPAAAARPVERGFARLRNWRVLGRFRADPKRATAPVRALLVLTNREVAR
ncbi:hypothetical protein [Kitasatospora mediocidica]|uniref:hypothetical protein n=1 Tax=Kitasatospora mediocidica TaxID=58352 RepID=UPI000A03954B|nr:hypothetical protein [Kitasatospora mediocidica]